jgi:oxygen-independent coproporphyrinogen-3 oxidase
MRTKTALYIHIPFCQKKCFFCSFAICIAKNHHQNDYLDCLSKEVAQYPQGAVETVYIGGGTPTLLNEAQLQRLHQNVVTHFKIQPRHEYSIETNPDTMDLSKAKLLRELRVNRVSIGAQTFDPAYLKFLGRTHQPADIHKCFDRLRKAGFSNINIDMMFGFPGQSLRQLKKDLNIVAGLGSEHLSYYNLSVEQNSLFHRLKLSLPNNDHMALCYRTVMDDLEKKGFHQYEISNFAKPGKASAHNILYWECQDYVGLGMGAHSHLRGKRFWNQASLFSYMKSINAKGQAIEGSERLSGPRRLAEALLFGLRMNKGVDIPALEKRFRYLLYLRQKKQIIKFVDHGFFQYRRGVLAATLKGRLVLDELCGYLI